MVALHSVSKQGYPQIENPPQKGRKEECSESVQLRNPTQEILMANPSKMGGYPLSLGVYGVDFRFVSSWTRYPCP
jgi:hypothetical protein